MLMIALIAGGALAGLLIRKFSRYASKAMQICGKALMLCTLVLIFCMGSRIGTDEQLLSSLGSVGLYSFVLCFFIMLFTAAAAMLALFVKNHLQTRKKAGFGRIISPDGKMKNLQSRDGEEIHSQKDEQPAGSLLVIRLIAALLCGLFLARIPLLEDLCTAAASGSEYVLDFLLVLVGITIGANDSILSDIRRLGLFAVFLPLAGAAGSLLGGMACSFILGAPLSCCAAVSAGLGWYSLEGILLAQYISPFWGSIGFLTNLLREISAYLLIPLLAKKIQPETGIALAGATSTDTSLPVIVQVYGSKSAMLSVISGLLSSALVPVLISLLV